MTQRNKLFFPRLLQWKRIIRQHNARWHYLFKWCHCTWPNEIQHNGLFAILSVTIHRNNLKKYPEPYKLLNVAFCIVVLDHYAECRYDECCYAECRGAIPDETQLIFFFAKNRKRKQKVRMINAAISKVK